MEKNFKYNIGVDIGTDSSGYCVTLANGQIVKFHGKNMYGVRKFSQGVTAKDRRLSRSVRRRYARRKTRIFWLQDLIRSEFVDFDITFFDRLKESFLKADDRNNPQPYILFNDANFNEKSYFKQFPTIYHLRQRLIEDKSQADIRLVYLALHHIIKYRGNFLYEGQSISGGASLEQGLKMVLFTLPQFEAESDDKIYQMAQTISKILKDKQIRNTEKEKEIVSILDFDKEEKNVASAIAKALLGLKADFKMIFNIESEGEIKSTLADEELFSKLEDLLDENQTETLSAMIKAYSALILCNLLSNADGDIVFTNISQAMISKFLQHKKDLKEIKALYKKYLSKNQYENFFRGEEIGSYESYISKVSKCDYESLQKYVKNDFAKVENISEVSLMLQKLADGDFLPKINNKDNGAIPYQLHKQELETILDNQGVYYPSLKENKDKIISILEYRIPYYVGPLSADNTKFKWMERKKEGTIYPWNFEEIVDKDAAAEMFINRMRNKCSYLYKEETMPKCSLLYSEFEVRNEIKQIKLDDKFMAVEMQNDLYEEVFKKIKTVKEATLRRWLKTKGLTPDKITGYQKEKEFATSLKAYIDFTAIFGKIDGANRRMIENFILWLTIFNEKDIILRKIQDEYPQISKGQKDKIIGLKYTGWSKLSEKLLTGLKVDDKGAEKSIMDFMRSEKLNFMQIVTSKKLGFNDLIDEENDLGEIKALNYQQVVHIPTSPANKKAIWQTLLIIKEIEHIMGHSPENIYVEFARTDEPSKRTNSRYNALEKLYREAMKNNSELKEIGMILSKNYKGKDLDNRRLYLYFMQNGKCLYTGKPLDINNLSLYEIDHIIPRSYIKDDSFDNLALVFKQENQHKGASMLLDRDIINHQRAFWLSLLSNGLISRKKFNNLTRETVSEEEVKGFVARQLVETRQITKHVTQLLTAYYSNTNVVSIKAELSSNLRKKFELYKNRNINDYHHAYDAFLACVIGRYVQVCYPNLKDEFVYKEYRKFVSEYSKANANGYGYIIDTFNQNKIDFSTGELIWNGQEELNYLIKVYGYKDCFISKMVEEQTGKFYDQTIYPHTEGKLIPLKENLPACSYGGYKGVEQAYYAIIEFGPIEKRKRELVGVPIYIVALQKTKPNAIQEYFEKQGYNDALILKDHIKKFQKIIYEGNEWYLTSDSEVINAKQLILCREDVKVITLINNANTINSVEDRDINKVINNIIEKMEKHYPCFNSVAQRLKESCNIISEIDKATKAQFINEMLKITKADPSNGAFAKFKISGLVDRMGRRQIKNLAVDKIKFVDTSVTGLFEKITSL